MPIEVPAAGPMHGEGGGVVIGMAALVGVRTATAMPESVEQRVQPGDERDELQRRLLIRHAEPDDARRRHAGKRQRRERLAGAAA